ATLRFVAKVGAGSVHGYSALCLALSILFGIFTLAIIPLVTEQIKKDKKSVFDIRARFKLFYIFGGPKPKAGLKIFCWPQHVFFLVGIALYVYGLLSQGDITIVNVTA